MKKKVYIRFVISIFTIIIFFLLYSKYFQKKGIESPVTQKIEEEDFTDSNQIKDIKYSSKDLKGNEYVLLAKEGEIDLDNNDIIFLKDVTAYIKIIKNNEIITIISSYGKYNTINYDTIFSDNVKINYLDNQIMGDYLDFSIMKNILIISKNVVYINPKNILKADVVELNTITKDTKIFMYNSKEKVNIESVN
ncbi:LPS export ABC transporter periplasmic protein LptC [Candidatus Pelagibacter sp.]|nr:LPS export ABC transporter periplasmic protein LptC [Candidatus Pelagibacter sp.]